MIERSNNSDRITRVESKIDEYGRNINELVDSHKETNTKLDQIIIMMAEQRGAGKMAKWVAGAVVSIIGAASGLMGGNIAVSVSKAQETANHFPGIHQ